jgi:hypothetical protein
VCSMLARQGWAASLTRDGLARTDISGGAGVRGTQDDRGSGQDDYRRHVAARFEWSPVVAFFPLGVGPGDYTAREWLGSSTYGFDADSVVPSAGATHRSPVAFAAFTQPAPANRLARPKGARAMSTFTIPTRLLRTATRSCEPPT